MKSFTLLATILTIYRCEAGKRVSHRLHLDWAGASCSASWHLVPWASSWGQGTPGLLLVPALPAGMKAWWKTVVVLAGPWGKTLICNYVLGFWRESALWGQVVNLRVTWKIPQCCNLEWGVTGIGSGGWSRSFGWGKDWVKNEAEQEECSLKKINVLLLPFPVPCLQNNISRVWPAVLYRVSLLKQDSLSYLAYCFAV